MEEYSSLCDFARTYGLDRGTIYPRLQIIKEMLCIGNFKLTVIFYSNSNYKKRLIKIDNIIYEVNFESFNNPTQSSISNIKLIMV